MNTLAVVGLCVISGGLVLGGVFITIGAVRTRMIRDWTRTTGVVTDRDGNTDGMRRIYPTFMWQDRTGAWHRHTSIVRQSFPPRLGSPVAVRYDPTAPHRGVIDTYVQTGQIFTVVGIMITSAMCGVGLVLGIASLYV